MNKNFILKSVMLVLCLLIVSHANDLLAEGIEVECPGSQYIDGGEKTFHVITQCGYARSACSNKNQYANIAVCRDVSDQCQESEDCPNPNLVGITSSVVSSSQYKSGGSKQTGIYVDLCLITCKLTWPTQLVSCNCNIGGCPAVEDGTESGFKRDTLIE